MLLNGIELEPLTPLVVKVEGTWLPLPKRDWTGIAETVVTLLSESERRPCRRQCGGGAKPPQIEKE